MVERRRPEVLFVPARRRGLHGAMTTADFQNVLVRVYAVDAITVVGISE